MPPFDFNALLVEAQARAGVGNQPAINPFDWQNAVINQPIKRGRQGAVGAVVPRGFDDPNPMAEMEEDFLVAFENGDDEIERAVRVPPKPKVMADYSSRVALSRSSRLPHFKLAYQGADEFKLRLDNTIVQAYDTMMYIRGIGMVRCDFTKEIGIGANVTLPDGSNRAVVFNPERTNLRSPDPGYIQVAHKAYLYSRIPARVYKQGIFSENTMFLGVGKDRQAAIFGNFDMQTILTSFDERPIIQWQDVWPEGLESYRLSDRVALYRTQGGKINVWHKGHSIGVLKGRVVVGEKDYWAAQALAAVGIKLIEE